MPHNEHDNYANKDLVEEMVAKSENVIGIKIQEILHNLDLFKKEISYNLKEINMKLGSIEEQTKKTNGRVTKLEDNVIQIEKNEDKHANNCPHAEKIKKLEENALTSKAIVNFFIKTITIVGVFLGAVYTLLKIVTL